MNIFYRIGDWWEKHRVVRSGDLAVKLQALTKQINSYNEHMDILSNAITESSKVPAGTANELKAIRTRLDQLELYVGLKREKKPDLVPGAARIG